MRIPNKILTGFVTVVAAVGLVGTPAVAEATPAPQPGVHQATWVGPAGYQYGGRWAGHTRSMVLNVNGWGYMTLFAGAADGARHLVSWSTTRTGVRIRLHKRVATWGAGVPMRSGTVYYGGLVRSRANGNRYLDLGRGSTWCHPERFGNAPECGA